MVHDANRCGTACFRKVARIGRDEFGIELMPPWAVDDVTKEWTDGTAVSPRPRLDARIRREEEAARLL